MVSQLKPVFILTQYFFALRCDILSIVNGNNSIEEEIKERMFLGNKAYYANRALFKSKLLSKNSKLKIYWTSFRPVITYAFETWVLKGSYKTKTVGIRKEDIKKNLSTH
jgi:hypothetical protein